MLEGCGRGPEDVRQKRDCGTRSHDVEWLQMPDGVERDVATSDWPSYLKQNSMLKI